jgi:hypothetical protein
VDDIEKLKHSRLLPEQLAPLGQQALLNLVLSPGTSTEIFVKVSADAEPADYGAMLIETREKINKNFDELMKQLGYPEGTGKFIS